MRGKKRYIKFLSIIAFILSIGPISWIVYGSDTKDIDYSVQEELVEEGTKAKLTLELTSSDRVVEISSITLPDGTDIVGNSTFNYEVEKNGEYKFIVIYRLQEGESTIEKELIIPYLVESIQEKTEEKILVTEEKELLQEENSNIEKANVYSVEDIDIDAIHFPDDAFRNWILNQEYGYDYVLTAREINSITEININGESGIVDLTGIEYFSALTDLNCSSCYSLKSLNLSSNKNLRSLICSETGITNLIVRDLPFFSEFSCFDDQFENVDFSGCPSLKSLSLGNGANSDTLRTVNCSNAGLVSLSLARGSNIVSLDCSNNQLTTLNIRRLVSLQSLNCSNNQLSTIDLSNQKSLSSLNSSSQRLKMEMLYEGKGIWGNDITFNSYELTRLDNPNIRYDNLTKKFTSSSSVYTSSNFTTECVDGVGRVQKITGTINFTYGGFIPVTNISGIPTNMIAGTMASLNSTIEPSYASEKDIVWSIKDAGTTGATLNNNTLKAMTSGTVVITATIPWGISTGSFTKDFSVVVNYEIHLY